jgi:hypothetical protein
LLTKLTYSGRGKQGSIFMAREGSAAWYRERAAALRALAEKSRDPDVRLDQLNMAEQFDRLARRAEAQEKARNRAD